MLKAYAQLRAEGLGHQLVAIVERQSGHRQQVLDVLAGLNLPGGSVEFLHSLGDSDLRSVYTHADAMCFCSFAEGFGFPPLQAAACGVPVAASRLAVLEETLGSSAIYFDPDSVVDIAQALRRVLSDHELRARLRRVGPSQAARFQPQPWVARHLKIYRELHTHQTSRGFSQQRTAWPAAW
jgi:glycosyltransferase involved in cell wall biosynthesis